jgi:C4-dicarboxylate transporter, DctM subunit
MKALLEGIAAGENLLLALALALMALIPLAEAALRSTFGVGISGSASLVQHLCLVVGMVGGAVAARENRLLSLATTELMADGWWKTPARIFANGFAAAIAATLALAAWQFVTVERQAGQVLVYGIRIWMVQLVMPAGFALVALRLVWHASKTWKGRAATLALAVAMAGLVIWTPLSRGTTSWLGLSALVAAMALGAPIFTALGGAALLLFWGAGEPIAILPVEHYQLVTNPSLPAIPLFTLAGYFLAEGGASKRLVRVFDALLGQFRGGPAIVTALVCAFFTSFTGASGVTILALGGLLMPVLIGARYSERAALGLLTGAGSLGLLFPPCLPLILYAIIAGVPIERMFLGGILPGTLLVVLTAWWGVRQGPRVPYNKRFEAGEAGAAMWAARWELLLPVVALAGLFSGYATPVEAAALTALYAFVAETMLHRDLGFRKDVGRVMKEAGLLVGGVLLILGVALGFTNYLVDAQIPARAVDYVRASIHSPLVFLLLLNLFLLVVGCLMDIFSAIVVVVPLIVPMGAAFGIDPVHLGIIFLANMELGFLTPPVGMNLFLASYRFGKPVVEVYRAVVPMLVVLLLGVLLITYVPAMTTALPGWFGE